MYTVFRCCVVVAGIEMTPLKQLGLLNKMNLQIHATSLFPAILLKDSVEVEHYVPHSLTSATLQRVGNRGKETSSQIHSP